MNKIQLEVKAPKRDGAGWSAVYRELVGDWWVVGRAVAPTPTEAVLAAKQAAQNRAATQGVELADPIS